MSFVGRGVAPIHPHPSAHIRLYAFDEEKGNEIDPVNPVLPVLSSILCL